MKPHPFRSHLAAHLLVFGLSLGVVAETGNAQQTPSVFVKVTKGRVEEFHNGSLKRTFGTDVISAATDGTSVAVVTRAGRVEVYQSWTLKRTFGAKAVGVQISGNTIAVQTSEGRTEEYVNGSLRRTY